MATKAKPSATPSRVAAPENPLGVKLGEALALFHKGKNADAEKALSKLVSEARDAEDFGVLHTVRATLAALEAKKAKTESGKVDLTLLAAYHLNRKESQEALEVLDKAIKADSGQARLHFLKAAALAQLNQAEDSAESLQKAVAIDSAMKALFRLERDFDGLRHQSAFAAFERD